MKATCFLLLYNLVESSVSQSLTYICDFVTSKSKKYGEVKPEIKKIWIKHKHKNFKEKSTESIYDILQTMSDEIIMY